MEFGLGHLSRRDFECMSCGGQGGHELGQLGSNRAVGATSQHDRCWQKFVRAKRLGPQLRGCRLRWITFASGEKCSWLLYVTLRIQNGVQKEQRQASNVARRHSDSLTWKWNTSRKVAFQGTMVHFNVSVSELVCMFVVV